MSKTNLSNLSQSVKDYINVFANKLGTTGGPAKHDDVATHLADYLKHGIIGTTDASGTGTAYTLTLNPALSAYGIYQKLTVIFDKANTGAATININGKGVIALKKQDGTDYAAGELLANTPYAFIYNGTSFLADSSTGSSAFYGDGSDGALNTVGNTTLTVPVQDTGVVVKQYSSITINAGHTLNVDKRLGALIMYCTGDVVINGNIDLNYKAGLIPVGLYPAIVTKSAVLFDTLFANIGAGAGGNGGKGGDANSIGPGGAGGAGQSGINSGGGVGGGGGGGVGAGRNASGGAGGSRTTLIGIAPTSGGSKTLQPANNEGINGTAGTDCGGGGGGGTSYASTSYQCYSGAGSATVGGGGGGGVVTSNSAQTGGSGQTGNSYGGGVVIIIAKGTITIGSTGTITCNGGIGGSGGAGAGSYSGGPYSASGAGGGGGGGGGVVNLFYKAGYSNAGSIQVNGGTGGGGAGGSGTSGAGVNGSSGGIGTINVQKIK